MSVTLAFATQNKTHRVDSIEKLRHGVYKITPGFNGEPTDWDKRLLKEYVGSHYDWREAMTDEPLKHLPFEGWLGWQTIRYEAIWQSHDVTSIAVADDYKINSTKHLEEFKMQVEVLGYPPFIGWNFDWVNEAKPEWPVPLDLQLALSWNVFTLRCRYKEWEYEADADRSLRSRDQAIVEINDLKVDDFEKILLETRWIPPLKLVGHDRKPKKKPK